MKTATIFLLSAALLYPAPTFDVATVRRSSPDQGNADRESFQNGMLRMGNVTLKQIIRYAYGISETQIFGGPKWMEDYRFDVVVKADAPVTGNAFQALLPSVLAERFRLTMHHETRTVAGYALEIAKSGIRAPVYTGTDGPNSNTGQTSINAHAFPMATLAIRLAVVLQRPVVDMTGDKRAFDIKLSWSPDGLQGGSIGNTELPTLFTAVEEQLGLKLDARKVPVDAIIVDSVELPGEN